MHLTGVPRKRCNPSVSSGGGAAPSLRHSWQGGEGLTLGSPPGIRSGCRPHSPAPPPCPQGPQPRPGPESGTRSGDLGAAWYRSSARGRTTPGPSHGGEFVCHGVQQPPVCGHACQGVLGGLGPRRGGPLNARGFPGSHRPYRVSFLNQARGDSQQRTMAKNSYSRCCSPGY